MKEQDFLAKEKAREKDMRAEAYRKEQERNSRAEQARLETERIHEAQQKVVEARKRDMAARDAEREHKKADKQRIMVCFSGYSGSMGRAGYRPAQWQGPYLCTIHPFLSAMFKPFYYRMD